MNQVKKKGRGVLYMTWGNKADDVLLRSQQSLREIHPELPVEHLKINTNGPVVGLLEKSKMMKYSPFEETLFLDADTVVLDRLDFGFEKAKKHGLAISICEAPWARRYNKSVKGDTIEYNTGVMFFTKYSRAVFESWEKLSPVTDSSIEFTNDGKTVSTMAFNDQGPFAIAIEKTNFNPFVLPLNWNFRASYQKSFFGPIKIGHDYKDPPPSVRELANYYKSDRSIIQYHF